MDSKRAPNKRLFVGSLPFVYTEGELLTLFVPFGKVVALKIMRNRWGKSRGLGFVEFDNLDSAIAAKEKMHRYKLGDLALIVDYSEPDPFLTPEGQERHNEALERHPQRKQSLISTSSTKKAFVKKVAAVKEEEEKSLFFGKRLSPKDFKHQRQSVFESRFHHAKVGAKFAKRNKKK